eukprot:6485791-Amphidinium_carterae.1
MTKLENSISNFFAFPEVVGLGVCLGVSGCDSTASYSQIVQRDGAWIRTSADFTEVSYRECLCLYDKPAASRLNVEEQKVQLTHLVWHEFKRAGFCVQDQRLGRLYLHMHVERVKKETAPKEKTCC